MENYMPDEVFVEIKNGRNGQWIDTYLRLTDQQKDHFDIGKGFKKVRKDNQSLMKFQRKIWRKLQIGKDIRNFIRKNSDITLQLLPDVRKLYGITRHDLEILNSGLYRFPPHSKTTFPQLFEKPCVDKKTLGKRDGNNELEEIAQKINDLL